MPFKFQGTDFLHFDSLLSEDELLVRANTRAFIEDNLIPIIEDCARDGRFPANSSAPWASSAFTEPPSTATAAPA
jgi:glutaryl-CoA dehydrogenase